MDTDSPVHMKVPGLAVELCSEGIQSVLSKQCLKLGSSKQVYTFIFTERPTPTAESVTECGPKGL